MHLIFVTMPALKECARRGNQQFSDTNGLTGKSGPSAAWYGTFRSLCVLSAIERPDVIVPDTGPLIHLAQTDALYLLRKPQQDRDQNTQHILYLSHLE